MIGKSNLALLNKDTGEIIEDKVLILGKKPYTDKGFVKIFVAFLRDIVEDKEISGKAIRLLMYVIEKIDYNTLTVYLHYDNVCKELNITRDTYYRWLRVLVNKGYIREISPKIYELRPYTAIKGEMKKVVKIKTDKEVKNTIKQIERN